MELSYFCYLWKLGTCKTEKDYLSRVTNLSDFVVTASEMFEYIIAVAAPGWENSGGQIEQRMGEEHLRGSGAYTGRCLRSRVPEMPFPAFRGIILQNSEDYKTSENTQKTTHFRTLNKYWLFFIFNFHINYTILLFIHSRVMFSDNIVISLVFIFTIHKAMFGFSLTKGQCSKR